MTDKHHFDVYFSYQQSGTLLCEAHSDRLPSPRAAAEALAMSVLMVYARMEPDEATYYFNNMRIDVHCDEATYELLIDMWHDDLRGTVELHHCETPHKPGVRHDGPLN